MNDLNKIASKWSLIINFSDHLILHQSTKSLATSPRQPNTHHYLKMQAIIYQSLHFNFLSLFCTSPSCQVIIHKIYTNHLLCLRTLYMMSSSTDYASFNVSPTNLYFTFIHHLCLISLYWTFRIYEGKWSYALLDLPNI